MAQTTYAAHAPMLNGMAATGALIDFDSIAEHRRLREDACTDAEEAAMEVALTEVRVELLWAFKHAFAGEAVTIPCAVKRADGSVIGVYEQDLNEALSDVWGDAKVEPLFLAMQAAPADALLAARTAFQTEAAEAYIAANGESLAAHRITFPEFYGDEVTQ